MHFGNHSDLWSFIRSLRELHDANDCEFLQHSFGGVLPNLQRRKDRQKEKELKTCRELLR